MAPAEDEACCSPYAIDYTTEGDPDVPGLCWTITTTNKGGIYTSGNSDQQLAHNILDCAVVLRFERELINLNSRQNLVDQRWLLLLVFFSVQEDGCVVGSFTAVG
jgi:hypothetical protein